MTVRQGTGAAALAARCVTYHILNSQGDAAAMQIGEIPTFDFGAWEHF